MRTNSCVNCKCCYQQKEYKLKIGDKYIKQHTVYCTVEKRWVQEKFKKDNCKNFK